MRLPSPAGLLTRLAVALRGMAAALERRARRPEDADADALAARFPGAPEHWVRYVATRAPHLARAPGAESERSGPAPATREPTRQAAPVAPLELAPGASRRRGPLTLLTTRDADEHGTLSVRDASRSRRGRLRLLWRRTVHGSGAPDGHDGGGGLDRSSLDGPAMDPGAPRQAGIDREPYTWLPTPPAPRANAHERRAPPAEGDGAPRTRGEPAAHVPVSPRPLRWVTLRRGETEPPATTEERLERRSAMLGAPAQDRLQVDRASGRRGAPLSALFAMPSPSRAHADVDLPQPSARSARRDAALRIDREDAAPTWPSLPPGSETAPSAHVPAPRLEDLRQEQEDGRWSE